MLSRVIRTAHVREKVECGPVAFSSSEPPFPKVSGRHYVTTLEKKRVALGTRMRPVVSSDKDDSLPGGGGGGGGTLI